MRMISILALLGVVVLLGTPVAWANTTCADAIRIVPDGSIHEVAFTADAQKRWFRFGAQADRSYALMNESLQTAAAGNEVSDDITAACGGVVLPTKVTSFDEPTSDSPSDGGSLPNRQALKKTVDGDVFFSMLGNNGLSARIRVVETTLFSPRWSTFSGFNTSWGFHNTTDVNLFGDIEVTLVVIRTTGEELARDTFTVAPGRVVFKSALGLGIAGNRAGNAIVTHDGPPGAIQADGFMVSPDGLTGFRVNFETRSPQK